MSYETLAHVGRRLKGVARGFWRSETGIATVEWVALAGGLVIATIAISYILMKALGQAAVGIASQLSP